MHKYFPHTQHDVEEMLKVIGAKNIDDLFKAIPKDLQIKKDYNIPLALSDIELDHHLNELAGKNQILKIFRGAGAYDTYTPSVVSALSSRQEFLTSYTPYQPEVSQGTLQYIFEFQSMITMLTGLNVANASMYDGATSTAEAMFMANAHTKKNTILVSETINPSILEVIKTYARYKKINVKMIPMKDGITDIHSLDQSNDYMGVIVQNPNYYGIVEDYTNISNWIHEQGGLLIINQDGQSLGILRSPVSFKADIAAGELQSLGVPLSFGGAYVGYLATTNALMRKMPGRICGVTTDVDGKRAFVLTLQAREQHIRRAKANSNICSNQSLMALSVTIYLSLIGKNGLKEMTQHVLNASHDLYTKLIHTGLFEPVFNQPFYREFALKARVDLKALNNYLLAHNILGPLEIDNNVGLFAVTEKTTLKDINNFIEKVVAFK